MPQLCRQGTPLGPTGTISAVMTVKKHIFPRSHLPASANPPGIALPERLDGVDKFACGRIAVVGGSSGMAGAAALSALAALRSGAGLVELHVPDAVLGIAASFSPCVMTRGHASASDGTFAPSAVQPLLDRSCVVDVLACGPGLGRTAATIELVRQLWTACRSPAVFDADGLWALAQLDHTTLAAPAGPRLLTPHGGELLRFLPTGDASGSPAPQTGKLRPARSELEEAAVSLAVSARAIVVLKGPASLVTDGTHRWHNTSGNPGMATAGSGDVLTGVIAALCGRGLCLSDAARLGVWVHGHAGDVAASQLSQTSLIATDLIDHLPDGFLMLEQAAAGGQPPAAPSG
jgi:ADP-dependent NAD(P)H-hydrate dehydratase